MSYDTATKAVAIVPNDTNQLTAPCYGIYVGGTGNIALVTKKDDDVVFYNAQAGQTIPVQASIVKATGTTATNLLALS